VTDDTLIDPLVNVLKITITSQMGSKKGNGDHNRKKRQDSEDKSKKGDTKGEKSGDQLTGGIALPHVIRVRRNDQYWHDQSFDDHTGCKVIEDAVDDDPQATSKLTFYVNVDNLFLRTDMKGRDGDVALKEAKFVYGNVLVGLALLHDRKNGVDQSGAGGEEEEDEEDATEVVAKTTRALSPFLIPMIDNLGALTSDDVSGLSEIGDEE